MFAPKTRVAVIAFSLLAVPTSQSDACEFLRRCFGGRTTYYAPVTAAYAPSCCPQPQCCARPVVAYQPQTCYRTVYQNVPVVAYRPMTTCNPCTGCPQTVMRPVTSYVTQARLVPYTSYRPVMTTSYAAPCATGCAAGATTAAYPSVTAYSSYSSATTAPSCCSPSTSVSTPTTYAPSGTVGSTVTQLGPPTTTTPSYSPSPSLAPQSTTPSTTPSTVVPQQTFEQDPAAPAAQPESRLRQPLQPLELNPSNTLGTPRALDPEGGDRMTALPLKSTFAGRLVSTTTPDAEYSNNGWRASN